MKMPIVPDAVLTDIGNALIRVEYITKFEIREQTTYRKGEVCTDRILQLTRAGGHPIIIVGHHDVELGIMTLTGAACPRLLVDLSKKHRRLNIEFEQVITTKAAIRRILKHLRGGS